MIIFYDHFYPAYKAGGPVQSLTNLVVALGGQYASKVITSAYDLNSTTPLDGIELNKWNQVEVAKQNTIDVWYDNGDTNLSSILSDMAPDIVYLNGLFSYRYVLRPLLICKRLNGPVKVVLCPRGMLQKGALAIKPLKKKAYLSALRLSGLLKDVRWHATNEEEKEDIQRMFGSRANIVVAPNIPRQPLEKITAPAKGASTLRLVYLSLITEKKNLSFLIELINQSNSGIMLDIYGPVKDEKYWEACKVVMAKSNNRVQYKGDVKPAEVQRVLSSYDAFVLLTKGENFGHALYESLSVGRPLITSHHTPWNDLEEKKAGWNVDISDAEGCLKTLNKISLLDPQEFGNYVRGAHELSKEYYGSLDAETKYRELFCINE